MNKNRSFILPVRPDSIPEQLKECPQWVGWRPVRAKRDQRWRKMPIRCAGDGNADVADRATWVDFDTALDCSRQKKLSGIGFVFSPEDDFCGVDLDSCVTPETNHIAEWANDIIETMRSYTEFSPSGTGVKIFLRGTLPGEGTKRGDLEVYDRGRYFTVTGHHLPGTPNTVEHRQEQLAWFFEQVLTDPCGHRTDEEVVELLCRDPKYAGLWAGQTSDYRSPSEADQALLNRLVRLIGNDDERVKRLFEMSVLAEREKSRRQDYVERTMSTAYDPWEYSWQPPTSTRNIQTIQDYSRTPRPTPTGPTFPRQNVGPSLDIASLSSDDEALALHIAAELAETHRDEPDWQVMFVLARRLKGRLAGEYSVDALQVAVEAFCEKAEKPAEDYFYVFLNCWSKVRLADGENAVDWAVARAREVPYPCLPSGRRRGEKYVFVGSVAYHLATLRNYRQFWFPVQQLTSLLKTTNSTVYSVIRLLVEDRIVQPVGDGKYSFTKKQAREYNFVGPRLDGSPMAV